MLISFEAGLVAADRGRIFRQAVNEEASYAGKLLGKYNPVFPSTLAEDVDFDLFWEVWDVLKENYVDRQELADKKLFYGALKGLVSAAGDPYTVFMEPPVAQEFAADLAGTFEGIGAEIGMKNEIITVIAPLPDMPAEKAGLKAGDNVYAIDGESTMGLSVDEAVSRIRGPKGTVVTLSIARPGESGLKDIAITRNTILVKSVRAEYRAEDNIYSIRITNFNEDTENLFNQAVKEIIEKNPRGIIVDMRNNPGGFLDTAIELASEWVDDGVIVTEKYSEEKKTEHLARGRARLQSFPTVVLVNQGSASASEIVAGALQDGEKATIVGMTTFGKGSVQTLTDLSDGSSVKITVAKWLTPDGRSINDEGIAPDVEIDLTAEDYNTGRDPQLDAAVAILLGEPMPTIVNATSTIGQATTTE
ncbi:MAG: S41 family peptidase [Planctomycetes bacterium]|nr:S41 family peptidase [Planctomycetota bacterium]